MRNGSVHGAERTLAILPVIVKVAWIIVGL